MLSSPPLPPLSTDQALPQSGFDVLVVGAGAAGLYTALCLPSHLSVGLITKDTLSLSASDWAQGGIAAVVDPQDSTKLHIEDTLKAGVGLCDEGAVRFLVEQAADCIANLVDMGVAFDRQGPEPTADLALTLEAAHSRRRVLHAADTTGRAVVVTLADQVLQRPNIQVLSQALVMDLWLDGDRSCQGVGQGVCQGVCLAYGGQIQWLRAGAVILATGGGGQVFAQTTNPELSTGDGVAIAHRAGATLRDLEFVQFHPTALTQPGAPRFLISEAVRGEGAHLIDRTGRRFAFDYHPDGELAPRDVVSRAIFSHLQKTEVDPAAANVWLDLRPIPAATIAHRFPNIIAVCQRWGIDLFTTPIPVAPAAHYWMGGIETDQQNRTSIGRLYAVGETASTGVHGANRLASNSLLECLVFGAQFRELVVQPIDAITSPAGPAIALAAADLEVIRGLRKTLPKIVWQGAGICREANALAQAIAQVAEVRHTFNQLPITQILTQLVPHQSRPVSSGLREWNELYNLLDVAALVLKSAEFRTESRGGHYRSDYPIPQPSWEVHTIVQGEHWKTAPVDRESLEAPMPSGRS